MSNIKPEWQKATAEACKRYYGADVAFEFLADNHPLCVYLKQECKELGLDALNLVLVHTKRVGACVVYATQDNPGVVRVESGLLASLTLDEQKAILSHELDHVLRPWSSQYGQYQDDRLLRISEITIKSIAATMAAMNYVKKNMFGRDNMLAKWKTMAVEDWNIAIRQRRHREYLADAAAAIRVGKVSTALALQKIGVADKSETTKLWRAVSMWRGIHPSIKVRVAAIKKMKLIFLKRVNYTVLSRILSQNNLKRRYATVARAVWREG